jgi:hypothetical protein
MRRTRNVLCHQSGHLSRWRRRRAEHRGVEGSTSRRSHF